MKRWVQGEERAEYESHTAPERRARMYGGGKNRDGNRNPKRKFTHQLEHQLRPWRPQPCLLNLAYLTSIMSSYHGEVA